MNRTLMSTPPRRLAEFFKTALARIARLWPSKLVPLARDVGTVTLSAQNIS
jgi:hypothetical protein